VIRRIQKWSLGVLIGFAATVFLLASLAMIGPSALILTKSVQVDGESTVFVSFEGHPECGAVLEYVDSTDLEAGEVISGDTAPCESRNLIIKILQIVTVIALIGVLLFVVWTWLGAPDREQTTPDPA